MTFKMRPAVAENVGVPVSELEAREAAEEKVVAEPKVEEKVEVKKEPEQPKTYQAVAKTPVCIRREPKLDGAVIAVLYPGNTVSIEYYDSLWCKLTYTGETAYVRKEYMHIINGK